MKKGATQGKMPGRRDFWIKAGVVVLVGLIAIFKPAILTVFFTLPLLGPVSVYHVLWALAVFILVKRMLPGLNRKISSRKIFGRYFVEAEGGAPSRDEKFRMFKARADRGALKSAFYWLLLLGDIGLWRMVGMLSDTWIYIIVLFFVFMDQFCVSAFCPFKWLARGKCCSTCRINNWGYFMAFSPLIYIPSFWTWSIVAMSIVVLLQWEYLYFRHPRRFFEITNAALTCGSCVVECTGHRKIR